jgi:hypothetical protein
MLQVPLQAVLAKRGAGEADRAVVYKTKKKSVADYVC